MRVLSIQQPWAYAITGLGKRIENRTWGTDYRGPIAIHATKPKNLDEFRFDLCTCDRMSGMKISGAADNTQAQAALFRQLEQQLLPQISKFRPAIIAVADLVDVVTFSDSKWYVDGFGLVFDNVEELPEPIPCKGQLGLWTPDETLKTRVLNLVEKSTRERWGLGNSFYGIKTHCEVCSHPVFITETQSCRTCDALLCPDCIKTQGGEVCDECEVVEESEVA